MKTLHIVSSPRAERSKSKMIWEYLANTIWWEIITIDINSLELPFITWNVIANNYWFFDYKDLPENDKKIVDLQNKYIEQLKSVDNLIISAPLWNFWISAALKAYIDLITKVWITFSMWENWYEWLVKNIKNFYIVITKWWVYQNTAWQEVEVLEKHLKQAFWFMWIKHTKTFNLEWTNMKDELTLTTEIENIKTEIDKTV